MTFSDALLVAMCLVRDHADEVPEPEEVLDRLSTMYKVEASFSVYLTAGDR